MLAEEAEALAARIRLIDANLDARRHEAPAHHTPPPFPAPPKRSALLPPTSPRAGIASRMKCCMWAPAAPSPSIGNVHDWTSGGRSAESELLDYRNASIESLTASLAQASRAKIPKLVHQSWKSCTIPPRQRAWQQHSESVHGWRTWLWTDEGNRDLIRKEFPSFIGLFDSYDMNIKRIDAVRYFYMFLYGKSPQARALGRTPKSGSMLTACGLLATVGPRALPWCMLAPAFRITQMNIT